MLRELERTQNEEANIMRRIAFVAGISALSLLAAGCGSAATTGSSNPSSSSSTSGPQKGGTVVYALPSGNSPNWFFPLISYAADSALNFTVDETSYLPLVYFNQKGQVSDYYGLATSIDANKAGTQFTVHMSPKFKWSNGYPVTAQDVVFTYQLMRAASLSGTHYAWTFNGQGFGGMPNEWKSVKAVGQHTVVITTTKPVNQAWFEDNGIVEIIPVPKSVWDRYPGNMAQELKWIKSIANQPNNKAYQVVDGPFKFSSYSPNNNWTYVPNPGFGGHKPYIAKLVYQYETSDAAEFAALKQGTINVGYLPAADVASQSELQNDTIVPQYQISFNYLQLNQSPKAPGGIGKAFADVKVRRALQMGVDQKAIIKNIWHGYGVTEDTVLAPKPQIPAMDPQLINHPLYPYNPAQGKKLLESDGYHMVNGVMEKNGIKLEFTMLCANGQASYTTIDQLLQSDWAREGIKVNLKFETFNQVISNTQSNPTQWAAQQWNGGWGYATLWPSGDGLFNTGGGENVGTYSNRTMNKLIQGTESPAPSIQASLQRMYQYEEFAAKNLPSVILLPDQPTLTVIAKNVHGAIKTYNPIGGWLFPNQWWISSN